MVDQGRAVTRVGGGMPPLPRARTDSSSPLRPFRRFSAWRDPNHQPPLLPPFDRTHHGPQLKARKVCPYPSIA